MPLPRNNYVGLHIYGGPLAPGPAPPWINDDYEIFFISNNRFGPRRAAALMVDRSTAGRCPDDALKKEAPAQFKRGLDAGSVVEVGSIGHPMAHHLWPITYGPWPMARLHCRRQVHRPFGHWQSEVRAGRPTVTTSHKILVCGSHWVFFFYNHLATWKT